MFYFQSLTFFLINMFIEHLTVKSHVLIHHSRLCDTNAINKYNYVNE